MLNRRANERPGLIQRANRQRQETMLLTREAFRHLLLKYCQREIRHGQDFCLAGLNVLEYEQVQEIDEQAADQLMRLVQDICLRSQREKDRLCRLSGGNFVLILPDTDKHSAEKSLERLASTLAGAKTHYHQKPLKASCTFHIAHSKELGANIEALLNAIGFGLDETGDISLSHAGLKSHASTDSGNFDLWFKRYKDPAKLSEKQLQINGNNIATTDYRAVDQWSNSDVLLRQCEFVDSSSKSDTVDKITKRACILEELDHPGIVATTDFQFENDKCLWLAREALSHPSLKTYIESNKIDHELALDWCHQLLNLVIYLQSLVPPIVPALFNTENLLVNDAGHLVLVNFEANYLFACLAHGAQSSNTDLNYQAIIVNIGQLISEILNDDESKLKSLLQRLKQPLPKEFDTAYKLRALLKPIEYGKNK